MFVANCIHANHQTQIFLKKSYLCTSKSSLPTFSNVQNVFDVEKHRNPLQVT
jgi:hypothetical protein